MTAMILKEIQPMSLRLAISIRTESLLYMGCDTVPVLQYRILLQNMFTIKKEEKLGDLMVWCVLN